MLFGKLFTNPKMWVNGDADDITMGGVYTCKDVQNVPTGDGALFVFKTEDTVKQVFVPVGEEGVVYTRVIGENWASVTGTSEETEALIQSAIDKANQAQAKADTVDTRLNNIIVESGTSDAEVVAARTDSNGQTFTTLGVRLDTQFGEIKEDLSDLKEKITTRKTVDFDDYISSIRYISPSLNTWAQAEGVKAYMVPTNGASTVTIRANPSQVAIYACLTDSDNTLNAVPKYATGWTTRAIVTADTSKEIKLPDDCRYLWFMTANATTSFKPDYVGLVYYLDGDTITADINTLKSYHPDYSGKIVSILGDSISTFVPTADKVNGKAPAGCTTTYPGNVTQYQNSDVTTVDNTWWGQVLKYYGMTLGINESYAGSTIGYNPNYTNNGKYTADNCLCSETRIGHLGENGAPDIILVFGGTNDINHHMSGSNVRFAVGELDSTHNPYDFANFPMATDTYYGAITTMLLRIQHSYPSATILMLLPYFCTSTHTSATDVATPYDQNTWSNVAIDVCKYLGVEYLDLRKIINLYDVSTLLFDGLHPKANGMTAIANAVIHKLIDML